MHNKFNLICILVILSPILAIGQANFFSTLWSDKYQHTTTDNFSNEMRKVAVDTVSGKVFMLADFTSDLDINGIVTGNNYYYVAIVVTDEFGSLLNSKLIDVGIHHSSGFEYRSGFGLELDAAGNIYIGYTSYDPSTDFDINISKLNGNLDAIWSYKYNPVSDEIGIDLKVSPSGHAYAIVKSTSNMTNIRHRIIKATGAGTSAVPFYNFNSAPDYLKSLALDINGNIYVTGYRLLMNTKTILTASVSSTGTLRWLRIDNCGTTLGDDVGNHITVGSDGFIYFTGTSYGTLQHGIDVVTMKINSANGKKVWENFIHNNLTDGGYFIDATSSPDVINVCWTASNTVYVDQIFKLNAFQGRRAAYTPIPSSPYSGINSTKINDMQITRGGNIFLAGTVHAFDLSSQAFEASFLIAINFSSRGASRIVLQTPVSGDFVKSQKSVSVATDEQRKQVYWATDHYENYNTHAQESVGITCFKSSGIFRSQAIESIGLYSVNTYPSPALDHITMESEYPINYIAIYSMLGELVLEIHLNDGKMNPTIEVSNLTTGIYVAQLRFNDGSTSATKINKN